MRAPALVLTLATAACAARPQAPMPPVSAAPAAVRGPLARVENVVDTLHGTQVADPYRWLEQEKAPDVQAWTGAQDAATRSMLGAIPVRDALAKRFRELYYVDSISAPIKRGTRYFYTRTHADREKAVVYWKEGPDGAERVLLDPNGWSTDGTVSLGRWVPSWDGTKVVYGKRENAADEATLHVLDVASGTVSAVDVIPGGKYATPAWTPDGAGFYYEWLPVDPSIPVDARPGYTELRFHALGSNPAQDRTVHPKTGNPSTFLGGALSQDGRYLFVFIYRGWNENDVFFRDLTKDKEFRLLAEGKNALYAVEAFEDAFYVVTDEGAPKKRIFKVDPAKPERAAWVEVVKEDPTATIESAGIVGGRMVASYLKDARSELRISNLDGSNAELVALPGIGSLHGFVGDAEDDEGFFAYSSFTTPTQVWRFSAAKPAPALWAKVELPVDTSRFVAEQVFYASKDGTRVPMFIVRRKDVTANGANPTLLYGYGGFDVSLSPNFRSSIVPWLEAGGIYAVANLRGGGEYGKEWHDAGKGAHKQNVFDDFAAAAEYLVAERWTTSKKLAISGGSNGGLLVGAAMTQRPELYGAVVCAVPLLDMVRYHLFGSGRTWIPEYGSAEKDEEFQVLHAYSPYHRVKDGAAYPPLLMLAADHDDRVDPLHARKFVARVQGAGGTAWLRVEKNAGHGGADQVAKAIEQSADQYAFLFATLGAAQK